MPLITVRALGELERSVRYPPQATRQRDRSRRRRRLRSGSSSPTGYTGDQGHSPCQTCQRYLIAAQWHARISAACNSLSSWAQSSSCDSVGDAALASPAHE
eukprot:6212575-Pleurochrysis_carterae.AAC.2